MLHAEMHLSKRSTTWRCHGVVTWSSTLCGCVMALSNGHDNITHHGKLPVCYTFHTEATRNRGASSLLSQLRLEDSSRNNAMPRPGRLGCLHHGLPQSPCVVDGLGELNAALPGLVDLLRSDPRLGPSLVWHKTLKPKRSILSMVAVSMSFKPPKAFDMSKTASAWSELQCSTACRTASTSAATGSNSVPLAQTGARDAPTHAGRIWRVSTAARPAAITKKDQSLEVLCSFFQSPMAHVWLLQVDVIMAISGYQAIIIIF